MMMMLVRRDQQTQEPTQDSGLRTQDTKTSKSYCCTVRNYCTPEKNNLKLRQSKMRALLLMPLPFVLEFVGLLFGTAGEQQDYGHRG